MAKKKPQTGQVNLVTHTIEGIEELVNRPEVIEYFGQKVVHLIVPKGEVDTPEYVKTALEIARKLQPEIKSKPKPPWLRADWQAKKRKERELGTG